MSTSGDILSTSEGYHMLMLHPSTKSNRIDDYGKDGGPGEI